MTKVNSLDREKRWNNVFNSLVTLSKNLQKDRCVLEERIKFLHGVIYQMKLEQKVISTKSEHLLCLKEREAATYKHRYENASSELEAFKECFHYLCQRCSEAKVSPDEVRNREDSQYKELQVEVKRLRTELEKCKSEKNKEISALLAEKDDLWSQYKRLENEQAEQLKKKQDEAENANEKVQALLNRTKELHISNESLKLDVAKMESESVQKSKEIARLLKELEVLKLKSDSCKPESDSSVKINRVKQTARKSTGGKAPKKQFMFKECSTSSSASKGKAAIDIANKADDTPKLFSSSFKVPKLKPSSSSSASQRLV